MTGFDNLLQAPEQGGSSMIPARLALIGWSYAPRTRQVGLVIVIQQDRAAPADYLGPREWQDATFTAGACDREWLAGSALQTPEGVFGEMLTGEGFASPQHARHALKAFAAIAECEWARTMMQASATGA